MRVGSYDAVFFDLFGTLVDDAATMMAGVPETLASLDGVPWAIVTSCGTDFAKRLIAHARLPKPPLLVSADDVLKNKPAPDGYLFAAERLGVEPSRGLVVEDTLQGIASGRGAGMEVVGILRGRPANFVRGATYVVGRFADFSLYRAGTGVELELDL